MYKEQWNFFPARSIDDNVRFSVDRKKTKLLNVHGHDNYIAKAFRLFLPRFSFLLSFTSLEPGQQAVRVDDRFVQRGTVAWSAQIIHARAVCASAKRLKSALAVFVGYIISGRFWRKARDLSCSKDDVIIPSLRHSNPKFASLQQRH